MSKNYFRKWKNKKELVNLRIIFNPLEHKLLTLNPFNIYENTHFYADLCAVACRSATCSTLVCDTAVRKSGH